jgi:hypothetical protein
MTICILAKNCCKSLWPIFCRTTGASILVKEILGNRFAESDKQEKNIGNIENRAVSSIMAKVKIQNKNHWQCENILRFDLKTFYHLDTFWHCLYLSFDKKKICISYFCYSLLKLQKHIPHAQRHYQRPLNQALYVLQTYFRISL